MRFVICYQYTPDAGCGVWGGGFTPGPDHAAGGVRHRDTGPVGPRSGLLGKSTPNTQDVNDYSVIIVGTCIRYYNNY